MSQPSDLEIDQLRRVAHELREVFAERGYRVDSAMEVDPAFGSGMARGAMARDLAIDAISGAASRHGLDFRPVNGSGREFRCFSGGVDRRYRMRKARRVREGTYVIPANSDSALATDEGSLLQEETWVLGYTIGADMLVDDVFVAPVLGRVEGHPGHLVLGRIIELLTADAPTVGFQPTDEPLPGFEDDNESGEFGF